MSHSNLCAFVCADEHNRDLKIYDAVARRCAFITKDIFIEDNSHE